MATTPPQPSGQGSEAGSTHRADLPHTATEHVFGHILAGGVLAAAAIAALGAVLYLRAHGHEAPTFTTYAPQPEDLRKPPIIVTEALRLRPSAVIQLGVLVLVLTPVLRVAFSLVLFWLRRDAMYTVITAAVLAALLAGLLGGVA